MQSTNIPTRFQHLRASFRTGRTRDRRWRTEQLQALRTLIQRHEDRLLEALRADMGKPVLEAYASELGFLVGEIDHVVKNLGRWMKPERVGTPLHSQPGSSAVRREPLGVVLIIGAWNYPVQLTLAPLIGALAAGNCAVVKPSEVAENTSRLLAELLPQHLDPECVQVVEGGIPETQTLLEQPFDHVFFTGSTAVGKVVAKAAAEHLTPVTLELGGKSPCIVDREVDLEVAARRIAWGKFFNAGQTCVAPDYLLVDRAVEAPLLEQLVTTVREFYGDDPKANPDFARIVNDRHHQRLAGFLSDGEAVCGGETDPEERYIAPTILRGVSPEAPVMQEEIFGPVLPVIPVSCVEEAIDFVTERPRPLALYLFSRSKAAAEQVLSRTSSGGACVNDTMAHLAVPELPFGGVGPSGQGAYHGRHSFEAFSHRKSVLSRSTKLDVKIRYPPYGDLKWVKRLIG